jgi:Peptidase M15
LPVPFAGGRGYAAAMRPLLAAVLLLAAPVPAAAQELPDGQGEAEYRLWLSAGPGRVGGVLSFEAWQEAAGVRGVLPTWQMLRTASMWRECGGAPFEIPPHSFWPDMVKTLKFVRDHVRPAVGPVEAVSGYRNPALNQCARGSARSAHLDYFALDLIPEQPLTRRQLFELICPAHARHGPAAGVGLGFYTYTRFHIDTRSFRRWGSAGPAGNESPCAVLERGGDPEAPPIPPPPVAALPVVTPPPAPPPATPVPPPVTPPPRPIENRS